MTILLNNTVLSNFSTITKSHLIRIAFEGQLIATTQGVLFEHQRGVADGHFPECDWSWLTVLDLTPDERKELEQMPRRLGEGESECLVIARIRRFKFATDDWDARQMARRLGIPLTGTIGILIVLVKEKKLTLTEAEGFFTRMLNAGFRAPIVSIKEFLGNA